MKGVKNMGNLIRTFEEVIEVLRNESEHLNNLVARQLEVPFIKEASTDDRCRFTLDRDGLDIIVLEPNTRNENIIGFFIAGWFINSSDPKTFHVWEASKDKEDEEGVYIRDAMAIGQYSSDISLNDLIAELNKDYDICPNCHKVVGRKNMKWYSFAGRCCPDCLPALKKEYEQPGWYN